jgi:hypothetical protein
LLDGSEFPECGGSEFPELTAWAILALAAYNRDVTPLQRSLASKPDLLAMEDTSTLALVLLALDHNQALLALGVTS